jgi:hypothetical protein
MPKGKVGFSDVVREAGGRLIDLDAIIEPATIPPPNPGHPEFENESRLIASVTAGGASVRLLAFVDASDATKAGLEKGLLNDRLLGALASDRLFSSLGSRAIGAGGAAASDAAAQKTALDAGASHLVIARTQRFGAASDAMTETVSRLLDAASGKELARDVVWRASSLAGGTSRVETEFVNGLRVK